MNYLQLHGQGGQGKVSYIKVELVRANKHMGIMAPVKVFPAAGKTLEQLRAKVQ